MENNTPASPVIDEQVGANVKRWRGLKDFTQEAVTAEMVKRGFDFYQSTLYKIESGKRRVLVGEAIALAEILKVPLDILTVSDSDSEASLLAKARIGAQNQLRELEEARLKLQSALEHFTLEVRLSVMKLESSGERTQTRKFGDEEATVRDFYAPLINGEKEIQGAKKTIEKILKSSEKISNYLKT